MDHIPHGKTGLVLTGGGARGAYQAGALRAISEIAEQLNMERPFPVLCGTSAGALNAVFLAAHAQSFQEAVMNLIDLWSHVQTQQVFKIDPASLLRIATRWMIELSTGSFLGPKKVRALLDTSPLWHLVEHGVHFPDIQANIDAGFFESLAITAVNYVQGTTQTFYQTNQTIEPWQRARRMALKTTISAPHVMASTAIPILFPPVKLGDNYFGDGSLRNYAPMSPAIKLGARKLLVIGVRRHEWSEAPHTFQTPSLARVVSVILNSVFLDAVDLDMERLQRVNRLLEAVPNENQLGLQPIHVSLLRPSEDIGKIAEEEAKHMPFVIRHLIRGLGSPAEAADLVSYLLFEPSYTRRLMELGYQDGMGQAEAIRELLTS